SEDGIWDWDIEADRLYLSERWTDMLGLSAESTSSSNRWFDRVHPDDLSGLREAISAHLQGHTNSLVHEYRIRTRCGDYLWVLVRGDDEDCRGSGRRMAASQANLSSPNSADGRLRNAVRNHSRTRM